MSSIDGVRLDQVEQAELTGQILERALRLVQTDGPNAQVKIGNFPADDASLRDGLEQTYRTLGGAAPTEAERYAMVDKANGVRRWTLT